MERYSANLRAGQAIGRALEKCAEGASGGIGPNRAARKVSWKASPVESLLKVGAIPLRRL